MDIERACLAHPSRFQALHRASLSQGGRGIGVMIKAGSPDGEPARTTQHPTPPASGHVTWRASQTPLPPLQHGRFSERKVDREGQNPVVLGDAALSLSFRPLPPPCVPRVASLSSSPSPSCSLWTQRAAAPVNSISTSATRRKAAYNEPSSTVSLRLFYSLYPRD